MITGSKQSKGHSQDSTKKLGAAKLFKKEEGVLSGSVLLPCPFGSQAREDWKRRQSPRIAAWWGLLLAG